MPPLKDNFFLIADDYRREIYQADENLENIRALKFPQDDRPIGLTYDFTSARVFWADFHSHIVKSMFLNGSDIRTLIEEEKGKSRTEGIAFDPASQILYYTDSVRDIIGMMNPTGRFQKVLVRGIKNPRAIVLDPQNGFVFHLYATASISFWPTLQSFCRVYLDKIKVFGQLCRDRIIADCIQRIVAVCFLLNIFYFELCTYSMSIYKT